MAFYIRAWIKAGKVIAVNSDTLPIMRDVIAPNADIIVTAECSGNFIHARDLHSTLSWDGAALTSSLCEITEISPEYSATMRWRMTCTVSSFQIRAALLEAGKLADVEAAVGQADVMTKLAWAEATEFPRLSPAIAQIGAVLGQTDEQIDAIFIAAEGIAV